MSSLNIQSLASIVVNTNLWGRNGQSPHSIIHPKHPMRLCQTIQVQSLKEMKQTLPMGSTFVNTLGLRKHFFYFFYVTRQKPPIQHFVRDAGDGILRLAHTILVTEEFLKTENALDALLGSVRLALDAIEAQIWYLIFTGGYAVFLPVNVGVAGFSYRELMAYGRAAVHRIAGTDNVHVLMPVIHYAAMLLDNTAGITPAQQSGVTEHHLYDGPRATIIPVAHNTEYIINNVTIDELGIHDDIAFYPDYLPSLITKYVFEEVYVDRVKESSNNTNLYRVVLERYFSFELPLVYDYPGFLPAMPVVYLPANTVLSNTMAKYNGAFANLSAIASF